MARVSAKEGLSQRCLAGDEVILVSFCKKSGHTRRASVSWGHRCRRREHPVTTGSLELASGTATEAVLAAHPGCDHLCYEGWQGQRLGCVVAGPRGLGHVTSKGDTC